MAFASSLQKGQIPITCQLCEEGLRIEYRCKDCSLLICEKCKESHPKFLNAEDHRIIDIKDIGITDREEEIRFSDVKCYLHESQPCCMHCGTCNKFICVKCKADIHHGHTFVDEDDFNNERNKASEEREKIKPNSGMKNVIEKTGKPELKITRQFTTDLRSIHFIMVTADGSLWMGDVCEERLQHIRLTDSGMGIISDFDINVYDISVTSTDDILLSIGDSSLRKFSKNQSDIINTKHNISPLYTRGIHVTWDDMVIIVGMSPVPQFPLSGKRVVIVMDQEGKPIKEYEHDRNNRALFTGPIFVTSTNSGNICVVNRLDGTGRGQVVILSQGGDVISVYTGHQDINKDKPFTPQGIVTTQSDNIIITDMENHSLHILNSSGQFLTYYRTGDMGIILPYSLAVSGPDKLYIGCASDIKSPLIFRSQLYEMEYSGF